jgi:murein DD-endopeptidase MepM/ murein hydrolase activator NlpD
VRLDHHSTELNYGRRSRLSAGTALILFVVLLGGVAVGSYLCFFPVGQSQAQLSCNLPSRTVSLEKDAALSSANDDTVCQTNNGCQEMAEVTGEGDTLFSLLNDNLSDESECKQVVASLSSTIRASENLPFDGHTVIKPGRSYNVIVDRQGRFLKATVELAPDKVFHAVRRDDGIRSWKEEVVLDFKVESVSFRLRGDLEKSLLSVGEGPELASKLARVFKWDINFQSEAVWGDTCKVLFQRRYADDRPSGYGDILCAVYDGKKTKRKTAIFFNGQYYDEDGVELKKNFLRSPLGNQRLRISSPYGFRVHPILGSWRHHQGVDYAAPKGTPVRCVANGVVTSAGWNDQLGNYVCVKHDNGCESRYGHLSRIGENVRKGRHIKQDSKIGLVGMTGLATGPHLHFEWLVRGVHKDPAKEKLIKSVRTVQSPLKGRFKMIAGERMHCLAGITSVRRAARADLVSLR